MRAEGSMQKQRPELDRAQKRACPRMLAKVCDSRNKLTEDSLPRQRADRRLVVDHLNEGAVLQLRHDSQQDVRAETLCHRHRNARELVDEVRRQLQVPELHIRGKSHEAP